MATAPLAVAVRKILCLNTTTLCYFAFFGVKLLLRSLARSLSRIGTCERRLYAIDMCGNILLKFTTCEDSREEFSLARSKSSEVAWAQILNSLLFFFDWITVPLLSHLIRVLAYQRKTWNGKLNHRSARSTFKDDFAHSGTRIAFCFYWNWKIEVFTILNEEQIIERLKSRAQKEHSKWFLIGWKLGNSFIFFLFILRFFSYFNVAVKSPESVIEQQSERRNEMKCKPKRWRAARAKWAASSCSHGCYLFFWTEARSHLMLIPFSYVIRLNNFVYFSVRLAH